MKSNIINRILASLTILVLIFTAACEKDKIYPSDNETKDEFYELMTQWYYWKDSIPAVNPEDYSTPEGVLEGMRYLPKDKWSYITTAEAHSQYYEEGTYVGYGFGYAPDKENNMRVTFLYDNSDLKNVGIERGWVIKEINEATIDGNSNISSMLGNDEVGETNNIKFESNTGEIVSQDFAKKVITMNTVASEMVINSGPKKVGYFVFKSFIGPSENELNTVFNYFSTEQIEELVIDLRYNGGGRMDIVAHLAGLIIPDFVNGQVFVTYEHNMDRSNQNETTYFVQEQNSLKLEKVYFIAGSGSASASEVIINSLAPYLEVYLVGDNTYGKPVGMYAFESTISDLIYVPISFKLLNADGYGGYYDGLKADSYVEDDIYNDFGEGEAILDEVLNHIETGSFSSLKSSSEIFRKPRVEIRNLKDEIGTI